MAPNLQEGWGPINFILNFPRRRCIVFITSSLFQKINLLNSLHRSLHEAHSPHPDGRIPDLRLYRPCGSGQPGLGGRLQRHQVHRQQRRRLQLGLLPAGAGQTIIEAAGIIDGVFTLQTTRGRVTFVPLPRLVFPTWRPPFLRRQRSRRCNFQRDPTCLVPSSPWPMLVTRPPARLPGAIPGSADGRSLEKDIGLAGPARRHQSAGSRGCHSVHPGCLVWVVPFRPNEVL
jgi:hypothetical protein